MNEDLSELIERYFCDELSAEEQMAFEEKLASDTAFRQEVEAYEKTVHLIRLEGRRSLRARLAEKGRSMDAEKKMPARRFAWWAGLAVVLLALLGWWLWGKKTDSPSPAPSVNQSVPDTASELPLPLPDTTPPDKPEVEKNANEALQPSKPPTANGNSRQDKLFATWFRPYKDESLEPSVRGEGEATPEETFLQLYWVGKHGEALAAFEKMEPVSKNKGDLQFLKANALLASGQVKKAIAVLEKTNRTRFQAEVKWLLALAYLKNGQIGQAKAQFQQISSDETSPRQASARRLLLEIE